MAAYLLALRNKSVFEFIVATLALGMATGLLAGLFGIGGGMVIVPVLVFLFAAQGFPQDLIMIMAVATSLAAIIITAVASIRAHQKLGSLFWPKVFCLVPGILLGAGLGAVIADSIPAQMLKTVFIAYLFYAGGEMALARQPKAGSGEFTKLIDLLVGCGIGMVSALVGIGGGTMTVPYLALGGYPMRNAVAIASACGLPIALMSSLSYALLGLEAANLPEWSLGYVYLPAFVSIGFGSVLTAPLGAQLAHKLPAKQLKRYFSLLILGMAIKLLWF